MIESPPSFIVREECDKAAWQHGFRRNMGTETGWTSYASTTAQGNIYLAAQGQQGPWFLALDHPGVIEELGLNKIELSGPGICRFGFENLGALYSVLQRVYQLAASLPDVPFQEFQSKTNKLPMTTEAERLVIQRIGQDIFRKSLMDYWQGRCCITGITDPALLRASHILPWNECLTNADRLDIYNGLLLSALWDAAFDRGLVSFDDNGCPLFSTTLSEAARIELRWKNPIPLTKKHLEHLVWHRTHMFI